jgi:uncharacterized protein (TIRG00374 family)
MNFGEENQQGVKNLFSLFNRDKKRSQFLKYLLHAVILAGLFLAARRYLRGEEVIQALRTFDYAYLPAMIILAIVYVILKSWRFVLWMRPVTDIPAGIIFRGHVAGTAATLVPGGMTARAGLMKQAGVPLSKSSAPVALNSLFDQLAFIAGVTLAALWVEEARLPTIILVGILFALGSVFLLPFSRRFLSRITHTFAERWKLVEQWKQFRESVKDVLTPRIMVITMGITILALVMNIIILDLSLRGIGLVIPYASLFLAYVLPTMLGRLSALPGGVGITEAGMVGYLATTAQVAPEAVAASVAIFRITTILFQAILGAGVYFFAWQGEKEMDLSGSSSNIGEK